MQKAVKYSAVDGQKHIDLTLVPAAKKHTYEKALMVVNTAVVKGEMTREQLMNKLYQD